MLVSTFFYRVVLLSLVLILSGCITTSDRKSTVNAKRAHDAHLNLGFNYLQKDNREASRRHFEKALSLDPDSADAHRGIALLYELTGEFELAEKSFLRALKENSTFTPARVSYGSFLYKQSRYEEAYNVFEKATQDISYRQRALALTYLGQTALKLNNIVKAKSIFEHAVNIDNKLSSPLIELSEIYFSDGDYAKSKKYLDRYVAISGRTPRSLLLGIRIERIFGNKDKEASYILALKNLYPYSQEYLQYKQELQARNK